MPFRFEKLENQTLPVATYSLGDDDRRHKFLKKLSKDCQKGDVVVYIVKKEDKPIGLIGLGAARVGDIPCVQIEYIIVGKEHRGIKYEELGGLKISAYLMIFCLNAAIKVKAIIGARWLILTPDNEELERFYKKEFDFTVHDKIMYLKIPNKTTQKAMDDVRNGKNTESTTIEQIK